MTKEELGRLYPIVIEEYNKDWILLFEKEKLILNEILENKALRIEHFGSTAISNLKSKPTIDILIEIKHEDKDLIMNKMISNGYIHMKEQKNHLMFVKGYTPKGLEKESYHIHMGTKDQDFLWDRLYFRDYLKRYPDVKREYEILKLNLANKYKYDREAYTDNKADFVSRVTKLAVQSIKK